MSDELKPCPFCGGEAIEYEAEDTLADNGTHYIICNECEAAIERHYLLGNYSKSDKGKMKKSAIKAWNTRVKNDGNS